MKKQGFIFAVLILLMAILTGCGRTRTSSNILKTKENMGDGVLYYIPNENIEANFMQNLISFQGSFLVYGFSSEMTEDGPENTGFHLKLISPATGEVVADTSFDDMEMPNIQVCRNTLAVTDWGNGEILFLDEKLQETSTYQVNCEYNSMYVSPDAEKVYVFMPDKGLQITELSSGKMNVSLENTVNLFVSNECGNNITFTYTDKKTQYDQYGALNLETGEVVVCPFEGSFYNICYVNDIWMADRSDDRNTHYFKQGDKINILKFGTDFVNMTMHPETGNLIISSYDEMGFSKMMMYNADGKFISGYENNIEGASVQENLLWSEADNGYFTIMMDPTGKDRLMFWDMSTLVCGEDLSFQMLQEERMPEEAVALRLYERAKLMGKKFGIEIRIAEQMDTNYMDYKVEKSFDEYQIMQALKSVERAFSRYPKGYFKQLLYGNVREIELHLSGPVTNLEMPDGEINGFTSYAGFAQIRDDKAIIVLDIEQEGNLEEHLHHEIFHLTDDKLTFDAGIRLDASYSEEAWMKLNPEGFEYAYSTFELPERIFNEDYDVWFIEEYSKTFPREDRATIMEYAMLGDYNMFISAPRRQAKLEYLGKCIRDAFDTTGWPERTVWEETLERSY